MKIICLNVILFLLPAFGRAQKWDSSVVTTAIQRARLDTVTIGQMQYLSNINNILPVVPNPADGLSDIFLLPIQLAVTGNKKIIHFKKSMPDNFKRHRVVSLNRIKKDGWIKPVMAVGYSGATYLCYRLLDTRIQKISQKNKNGFQTFISNAVTDLGLGKYQSIALGGTTIFAFTAKNKKLQQTVIVWAGSLLINSIVTDQLKISFQRHRPNTGNPYNTFDWRSGPKLNKSFPSAHTSNIFTTATVFATQYKTTKWVPPVAYAVATLIGLSRIYDNAHWASDVLAGAAIGFLSAKAMNGIYKLGKKKFLFLPQAGVSFSSLSIVYLL